MSHYNGHRNDGQSSHDFRQFHRAESVPSATKRLIEMLDHVEGRVEMLREHASAVESERIALLCILSSVKENKDLELIPEGEREEIELTTRRLMDRTLTVAVTVTTPRNPIQEKALENVNRLYDELLFAIKSDNTSSRLLLTQYINACLSDCKGPVNQKFQVAILECTADDQKSMRKRLENLLNNL